MYEIISVAKIVEEAKSWKMEEFREAIEKVDYVLQ